MDAAEAFTHVAGGPEAQEWANALIAATQKYLDNPEGMRAGGRAAYAELLALDAAVERCEEAGG